MGDVKLAASAHVSRTSLSADHSRVGAMPLTEAPAFILPPRNLCIKEGATAKFEGRVRSVAGREAWGAGRGRRPCWSLLLVRVDLLEDLVCFGPTDRVNMYQSALLILFVVDFGVCWRTRGGAGEGHRDVLLLL